MNKNHLWMIVIAVVVVIAVAIGVWRSRGAPRPLTFAEIEQRAHDNPKDAQAQLDWGNALLRAHRDDEAAAALQTAAGLAPNDPRPLNALADVALDQRQPMEALKYLRQSLQIKPDDAAIWRKAGVILQHFNVDAAQQVYTRATQLDPKDAISWRQLGMIERLKKQYALGFQHIQLAAQLNPNDPVTQDMLGDTATSQGKYDVAKAAWDKLLALRPGDPDGLLGSAQVIIQTDPSPENLDRAGRQIEQAISTKPTPYAYLLRGRWNLLENRDKPAIDDLKKALAMDPSLITAHSFLSSVYARMGQSQLAHSESRAFQAGLAALGKSQETPRK
ncbi:MAG TPA: tetratricopeptide repeat protein [Chthonomonadaceae bacterium]|nr:tetratricopeptide repeat protein [Chthonomonadaceae bacterium]